VLGYILLRVWIQPVLPAVLSILPGSRGRKTLLRQAVSQSVDQFVLVLGSPLGPMTRFYPYPFNSDNCFVILPVGRPL
jgi:hypothetical protein